jgi:hypothetical protein
LILLSSWVLLLPNLIFLLERMLATAAKSASSELMDVDCWRRQRLAEGEDEAASAEAAEVTEATGRPTGELPAEATSM